MLSSIVVKKKWKLLDSLGKGAFGEIYTAVNIYSGEKVAVKVEGPLNSNSKKRKPLLLMEMDVLKKIQGYPYFCKLEAYGRFTIQSKVNSTYNYIIMQLLGPSLSKLRRKCQKFSIATTALLGKQILRAIEICHNVGGVVHRDIKPGNFCMGITPSGNGPNGTYTRSKCYMIDFGLCRSYRNSEGVLREERKHVGFRGTVAYASINAHEGRDLGRVDDLWSMFYMLVEFVRGDLPWKVKDKEKVAELKKKYTNETLVANLPKPFLDIMNYLVSLHFEDTPDYNYIDKLLDILFESTGKPKNVPFDWEIPEKSEDNILSESLCSNKLESNTNNIEAKTSAGIYNKPTDMKSMTNQMKPNIKLDTTNISASMQSSPAVFPKYNSLFSKNQNINSGENNENPPDCSILKIKQQQVQMRQRQRSQQSQIQFQQQQQQQLQQEQQLQQLQQEQLQQQQQEQLQQKQLQKEQQQQKQLQQQQFLQQQQLQRQQQQQQQQQQQLQLQQQLQQMQHQQQQLQQQQEQLQLQQQYQLNMHHQHHHHHHHHRHTSQDDYKNSLQIQQQLQQQQQQQPKQQQSYFNAHSHLKMNSITPPSSIDKDHHESEKLYKKALLNEINSLTDSMDQSPLSKQKSLSRSKIEQEQMIKSSNSKLKNKISGYYKQDEIQTNFRSPKTISKTNSPFNHGNSLSNSLSLQNKVKSISPTPSPISAKSQSSSQLLANNIMKSHSRSPSNLSCNTSRTRYYSIQLPKDSTTKSDAYHGKNNTEDMAYNIKNDNKRYDMEINDNILQNFVHHSHTHSRNHSHSHHEKKEKELNNRKSPSIPSKVQKSFIEDKMNLNYDYSNKYVYEVKYKNMSMERQKNKKYIMNSNVLPKPPQDIPPPVKINPRLRKFIKP